MQQIDTTGGAQNQMVSEADIQKEAFKQRVTEYMSQQQFRKEIKSMLGKSNQRLSVSIDDLRQKDPELARFVTKNPIDAVSMFEGELDRSIKEMLDDSGKGANNEKQAAATNDKAFPTKTKRYYINFEGNFGRNHVTPRGLKAQLVNQLVSVRGIVTRMGLVKPMIQTSVHYCEATKKGEIRHYDDNTNLAEMGQDQQNRSTNGSETFPVKDKDGNSLTHEYGYCLYKDSQIVTIQEMPENAPPGQLPRSVSVILQNDLVDSIKPGDRVEVTGVYRAAPNVHMGMTKGTFRTQIVATGVVSLLAEKQKPSLSEQDIKNIRKLAKEEDVFEVLGASVAPTIEGHKYVKKSILLQLLGGAEKVLENGTHLRGDINIMMVGDPSTAKSQLLRHIMDIAPLAINTTGRGSSGVGLTAAVAVDKDSGDRHLEAGAMVLADRGIVCIDEFDKMNDADRVAIHEVMEQQTVTIAKAGIHTSLNARCSVIAAANPIYSEYARDLAVAQNIGLPDSLLSRFDLLFVMLDEKEPEADRRIAERVITNHRFMNAADAPSVNYFNQETVIERELNVENRQDGKGTTVFEKDLATGTKQGTRLVTRDFLKKYISFVKSRKAPELHQDAIGYAAGLYGELRYSATQCDQKKLSVPVTVRTLETLIRLATAHAKLRLASNVEISDIEVAYKFLKMTIFNEPHADAEEDQNEKSDEEMQAETNSAAAGEGDVVPLKQKAGRALRSRRRTEAAAEHDPANDPDDLQGQSASKRARVDHGEQVKALFGANSAPVFDQQQKKMVFKVCNNLKDAQNKVTADAVWKRYMSMNDRETTRRGTNEPLINSKEEMIQIVEALENDNLVMYAAEDNQIILM